MSERSCLIVGASHAGVSLALQLRKEGWGGAIYLIGEEDQLPYHRPPLSKEHLAGDKTLDEMRLRPEKTYVDNNIQLRLGLRVERIDREAKIACLSNGEELNFDKLALCVGAKVRKLPIGEGLDRIFYIRTARDVSALSHWALPGKRVVIIGAGYVGLEAAAVLVTRGLQVTVLEMADRILQRVTSEAMSSFMQQLHGKHAVNIVTSCEVSDIQQSGAATKVVCADGSEHQADFVIAGIGIYPDTDLAEAAGLDVDAGIKVNEFAQTSDPDIYAAGDCSNHPSSVYQRTIRLESVQNANDQARIAAANICGRQVEYDVVPWFWSDQYNIKLQMTGLSEGYDELVCRGEISCDSDAKLKAGFALFYLRGGVLIAADCVARPKEFMLSKRLIKEKMKIDPSVLADESVEPTSFISQGLSD